MANGTWKIARRGNAQLPLVIVLALAVALVIMLINALVSRNGLTVIVRLVRHSLRERFV